MRSSFYEGGQQFRIGPAPVPTRGPGEALLRVRRVGICGTDLHIFQGHLDHRIPKGGVIGHETLAEVTEAPAASGFRAGERVVVEPLRTCGGCRACRMGAAYLCYRLRVLGVEEPGGMQEYWTVPVDRLLRVPVTLGDDEAANDRARWRWRRTTSAGPRSRRATPCWCSAAAPSARSSPWSAAIAAPACW